MATRHKLISTEDGRVWTIAVLGDADLTLESDLQAHFDAALDRGYRAVVLDLARTEFIDSNFMHGIWRFIRRIHAAGGDLTIACPSGPIRRSLEIFGVASRVNIYDDPREAATGLRPLLPIDDAPSRRDPAARHEDSSPFEGDARTG